MNWTLEVVVVPVSDVDRAKVFYADKLGFTVDHDTNVDAASRMVQLTPPGSGCSVVRGVDVSEVQVAGPDGFRPEIPGEPLDNVGFVLFDDPDGNGWGVQQMAGHDCFQRMGIGYFGDPA